MKYIKITELENLIDEKDVRTQLSNYVLPKVLTDEILLPLGYATVEAVKIDSTLIVEEYDTQVRFKAVLNPDGKYGREVYRVSLSKEEADKRKDRMAKHVRNKRNEQLTITDKLIFKYVENNIPVPTVLVDYRNTLRDLPETVGFPYNIKIPALPEGL